MREQNVALWHPDELADIECRSIAKSCARYSLWDFSEKKVSERQRRRTGKQWHDDPNYDYDTRNAAILSLDGMGFRQREIAEVVDISPAARKPNSARTYT